MRVIDEIEKSEALRFILITIFLNIFIFIDYSRRNLGDEIMNTSCWTFFQSCKPYQDIILLNFYPDLRPMFLTAFFAVACLGIFFTLKKPIKYAYYCLITIFTLFLAPWFVFAGYHEYIFTYPCYYLFFICFIFLFVKKHKIFFLQLFFLLSYFLSTISKIGSDAWIFGILKLPLIPANLMPVGTNLVILLQLCVPILLISKNKAIRLSTLATLEIFHLYTISFIDISFFCITSPLLFILFYYYYEEMDFRKIYKSITGLVFIILLVIFNFIRLVIPGEDYLTFEGAYLGFNMFQSYKGCSYEYQDVKYEIKKQTLFMTTGRQICDPYNFLLSIKKNCTDNGKRYLKLNTIYPDKVVNIVKVSDYCKLQYKPFTHNEWINPITTIDKTLTISESSQFFKKFTFVLKFFYTLIFIIIFLHLVFLTFGKNILSEK